MNYTINHKKNGAFWRGCWGARASGILGWDRVGERRRWRGDDFTRR